MRTLALVVPALVLLVVLSPRPAEACGGFFCSQSAPVNQAAERIIFADDGDGNITAVVQILYSGPSERFAWLLPVPTVPEIGVSSNRAFEALQMATNPVYRLRTTVEGDCERSGFADASVEMDASAGDGGGGPSSVNVAASGSVGPYDYVVIEVAVGDDDPAEAALRFLQNNGYDLMESGPDLIRPYLESEMLLVAFRLTKGARTGEIRPVTLRYEAEMPMIPIMLTAVAAVEDMGVLVWILGEHRAVPANYYDLILNEARINWLNPNSNYNEVVIEAVDEAGGHGFVTEFSGPAAEFADSIASRWMISVHDSFDDEAASSAEHTIADRRQLVLDILATYNGWDGVSEALGQTLLVSGGPTAAEDLLDCISSVVVWSDDWDDGGSWDSWDATDASDGGDAGAPVDDDPYAHCLPGEFLEPDDLVAFVEQVRIDVLDPLWATRELFEDARTLTRLYTAMSPDEMDCDPIFAFNADLPEVSNIHVAERIIECDPSESTGSAPWRVVLPGGGVVRGEGSTWPIDATIDMPALAQAWEIRPEGAAVVVQDHSEEISDGLDDANGTRIPRSSDDSGGCDCATARPAARHAWPALLLLAALILPRRSHHRDSA